jgi:hypothetical protein
VKAGQRVMFHFLNTSAIENRHLALPGHKFNVVALDGNPVPRSAAVDVLMLGPGERIDAWVEMNHPGVWVMGAPEDMVRDGGVGVVIEYVNQRRSPQWMPPPQSGCDYTILGKPEAGPAPPEKLEMIFEEIPRGPGKFNLFTVNGVPYPRIRVEAGRPLPPDLPQPHGRFASAPPAPPSVRNRGDLRQANSGHCQGYGGASFVWPGQRGLHRRSTRSDAVRLPHPAPHGLRVHGAAELRVSGYGAAIAKSAGRRREKSNADLERLVSRGYAPRNPDVQLRDE